MTARFRRRGSAAAAALTVAVTVLVTQAPDALAAWTSAGAGTATAAATVMPTGQQPVVAVSGTSVSVRWPAATLPGGTAVAGYVITRFNAVNGTMASVGAGCSGVITSTTCTELAVPAGAWVYTDTPVQANWTGPASPASAPASVG